MSASSPVYQRRRQASSDELARIPWLSLLSGLERERIEPQLVVGVAMPGDHVCRMGRSVTFWFGVIEGLLKMSTDAQVVALSPIPACPQAGGLAKARCLNARTTATTSLHYEPA